MTGRDVHVFNEEEVELMYPPRLDKSFLYNNVDTFIWFDMPEKVDKFCELCRVFEELIEKAYGAFKSPEDVCIGFIETQKGKEVLI